MVTSKVPEQGTPSKPRLYDFAEGFGSVYGRYVRNRLSERLIERYRLQTVLEVPANAEAYFASPGTQSVIFAQKDCRVTLVHPEEDIVRKTRAFWLALGLGQEPQILRCPDLYKLPFPDNQFDLVWNFDYLPLMGDPAAFIAEMARVSRNLVEVIVPNFKNIGYPIHALMMRLGGKKSPYGRRQWMAKRPIKLSLERLGLRVVEAGLVDMPPWPGFDALRPLGQLLRRNTVEGEKEPSSDAEVERMLRKLTFIEYGPLPRPLKTLFSHQLYVIGQKQEAE